VWKPSAVIDVSRRGMPCRPRKLLRENRTFATDEHQARNCRPPIMAMYLMPNIFLEQ